MRLVATFQTVTPVFCAGAKQKEPSEIRAFSLKGMLRWFYMALDGSADKDDEARIFGSASGSGAASPVLLRVTSSLVGTKSYRTELNPRSAEIRGECYLGYSLYLGDNDRKAVEPNQTFTVILEPRWGDPDDRVAKAWLAALWLLGHLGGIGSRMRRGFGTIALTRVNGAWPGLADLPLPHAQGQDPHQWKDLFMKGYGVIRSWFPTVRRDGAPSLPDPKSLTLLVGPGPGFGDWKSALHQIGSLMRDFRAHTGGPRNGKYPRNAAYGLPLTSRTQGDTIVPTDFNRSPSRLWIRVLQIKGRYVAMVWVCEAKLVPKGGIKWKRRNQALTVPAGLGDIAAFGTDLAQRGYR